MKKMLVLFIWSIDFSNILYLFVVYINMFKKILKKTVGF